jgi:flagellar FliL protein
MVVEQRVISSKPKIGAKDSPSGPARDVEPAPKKGRKKLLVAVLALVLVLGGVAGYVFLLAPKDGAVAEAAPEPEPGTVLVVDSISINLAAGRYLRLGLGLQLTTDVGKEEPDTARALDLAIALFSQRTIEEVNDLTQRAALKAELVRELDEAYEGEVMDVYFTDFVTQ